MFRVFYFKMNIKKQDELSAAEALLIGKNLNDVRKRIGTAATRAGRKADAVTLVAVSKTMPMAAIEAAYAL